MMETSDPTRQLVPNIQLVTPGEAAGMLRLTVKRVHDLVRTGKLGCVQVSARERLFTPAQIQKFVESRTVAVPERVKKPLDGEPNNSVSFHQRSDDSRIKVKGDLSRAQLREEMRQW